MNNINPVVDGIPTAWLVKTKDGNRQDEVGVSVYVGGLKEQQYKHKHALLAGTCTHTFACASSHCKHPLDFNENRGFFSSRGSPRLLKQRQVLYSF